MKIENEICLYIKEIAVKYLDYCNGIQKLYLFFSFEQDVPFSDFFIKTNQILEKNEADKNNKIELQTSIIKQKKYLELLSKDFATLIEKARQKKVEIPTEIKAEYDCKSGIATASFCYENKYSEDENIFVTDLYEQWIDNEKKKLKRSN